MLIAKQSEGERERERKAKVEFNMKIEEIK